MKVKYIGESFGVDSLTDGCVYECVGVEGDFGFLRTVDDRGEDYLYSATNPRPLDHSCGGGKWEIVEDDPIGTLQKAIGRGK